MNPESKSDQDRWRELADLLGLPAEDQSVVPASRLQPAELPRRLETAASPGDISTESLPSDHPTQEPTVGATMPESNLERHREEGRPRRGRRGRSHRGAPDDAAEAQSTPTSPEAMSAPTEDSPSSGSEEGRDRSPKGRRGRRKSAAPEVPAGEGESGPEAEDEDIGDYAKWNLPSWEELIASLKRP